MIYLIGSLRNPRIPLIANELRANGYDVFDDWFAAGPTTDDDWQRYEATRNRSYKEALYGEHARDVFEFDTTNLRKSDSCVLALPAGKSGHLEFGWMMGLGKKGWVLFEREPERYDIMYQFATGVCFSMEELLKELTSASLATSAASGLDRLSSWEECSRMFDKGRS